MKNTKFKYDNFITKNSISAYYDAKLTYDDGDGLFMDESDTLQSIYMLCKYPSASKMAEKYLRDNDMFPSINSWNEPDYTIRFNNFAKYAFNCYGRHPVDSVVSLKERIDLRMEQTMSQSNDPYYILERLRLRFSKSNIVWNITIFERAYYNACLNNALYLNGKITKINIPSLDDVFFQCNKLLRKIEYLGGTIDPEIYEE